MKIDPKSGAGLNPLAPSQPAAPERPAADANTGVAEVTAFLPSTVLAGLMSQLRLLPDVRGDLIRQVRERLAKGDLLTPVASAEVAAAILGTETHGG